MNVLKITISVTKDVLVEIVKTDIEFMIKMIRETKKDVIVKKVNVLKDIVNVSRNR